LVGYFLEVRDFQEVGGRGVEKVLIVADEANIVFSVEYLLQQAGYWVDSARTQAEAMAKLDQFAPDLVLLDVAPSGTRCLEFLQQVRRDGARGAVAIIMLAPKGREVEVNKGLALGASAAIAKPFSTSDLLGEVRRWLDET
jgi:DNA-binding response OmpR family regulator